MTSCNRKRDLPIPVFLVNQRPDGDGLALDSSRVVGSECFSSLPSLFDSGIWHGRVAYDIQSTSLGTLDNPLRHSTQAQLPLALNSGM